MPYKGRVIQLTPMSVVKPARWLHLLYGCTWSNAFAFNTCTKLYSKHTASLYCWSHWSTKEADERAFNAQTTGTVHSNACSCYPSLHNKPWQQEENSHSCTYITTHPNLNLICCCMDNMRCSVQIICSQSKCHYGFLKMEHTCTHTHTALLAPHSGQRECNNMHMQNIISRPSFPWWAGINQSTSTP